MKNRLFLVILFACLATAFVLPAPADTLYENGTVEGSRDAWTINLGFIVSDTFTISTPNSMVNGFQFAAWVFPGDVIETVEVSITSDEFGGTTYFDQQVPFTASGCFTNHYGFNVCTETGAFSGVNLAEGTYWLNLQNAVVNTGDPVYWDENSGEGCHSQGCPSMASQNSIGVIPSETFSILGSSGNGTVPEPGSLLLFGSGLVAGVSFLRHKLR